MLRVLERRHNLYYIPSIPATSALVTQRSFPLVSGKFVLPCCMSDMHVEQVGVVLLPLVKKYISGSGELGFFTDFVLVFGVRREKVCAEPPPPFWVPLEPRCAHVYNA